MDGHKFESLEIIVDNEEGLTVERTIALRPYPALKLFRDAIVSDVTGNSEAGNPTAESPFGRLTILSVLVDAQSLDPGFERLSWNAEFRSCAGRPRNSPMTLHESRFDHFNFPIFQS